MVSIDRCQQFNSKLATATDAEKSMKNLFPSLPSVREIATGYYRPIIATVSVGNKVSVWDINSSRKLSEFESSWDIGGRRLAISDDGKLCAVGAYERYGVTVHDSLKGAVLWKRKDLKKVQNLRVSRHKAAVLAGIDQGAFRIVNAVSGADFETLRGINEVWESPFGPHVFKERKSGSHLVEDFAGPLKIVNIPRNSFGVLDACFSREHVAVSEAGGSTSLYALYDGRLVWKYSELDHHVLRLEYCAQSHEIVGINYRLGAGGGTDLIAFDLDTGVVVRRISRNDLTIASFALEGSRVITSNGNVVDVTTGEVVSRLDFP